MDERQKASLERFINASARWVRERRDFYREGAKPLEDSQRNLFKPFFPRRVLDEARFISIGHLLEGPKSIGVPSFDLESMMAFTFVDTIVETPLMPNGEERIQAVRFHELVHVVQTGILGVDETIRRYLSAWADGGFNYWEIPFELQAFELEMDFRQDPSRTFSVEDRVRRSLQSS